MISQPAEEWQSSNQSQLMAALTGVKAALRRHAEKVRPPSEDGKSSSHPPEIRSPEGRVAPAFDGPRFIPGEDPFPDEPPSAALDRLCVAFNLSPFERDLLLLCAGVELDSTFAPLCAAAQGDPSRAYPTFSLALAALPNAHWSALTPDRALRRWRLVEVGAGPALTVSPLRIDERVLHFLAGLPQLDERLAGMIEAIGAPASGDLAPSHAELARRVAAAWTSPQGRAGGPVVQLSGASPGDCRAVAAAAAAMVGLRAMALPVDLIPTTAAELDAFLRLWEREAALAGSVLLVECDGRDATATGEDSRDRAPGVARLVERLGGLLIVSAREPRSFAYRPCLNIDVHRPTPEEQQIAWRAFLGPEAGAGSVALDSIAFQFNLVHSAIRAIAAEAIAVAAPSCQDAVDVAWHLCRAHCRTRLDSLAQRVEALAGWEDLVLPESQRHALRQVAIHVRHRATVYGAWGFARKSARGLGIASLFAGASGTGKTMAAEVLANELRLDLYRIDLASMVSKYIGETEKNLRRVFDAAEESGAILLFDEADALFGKRSDVKDSHDRYANIEVSYLLQRVESYRGLVILTTNLKSAVDTSFLRRIRFIVQFPFPDATQRAEIWRRVFPPATPVARIDFTKLSLLNLAGGNIRNIAMNAAFLAADANEPVRMCHLRESALNEFAKLERPLGEAEIGGWI